MVEQLGNDAPGLTDELPQLLLMENQRCNYSIGQLE